MFWSQGNQWQVPLCCFMRQHLCIFISEYIPALPRLNWAKLIMTAMLQLLKTFSWQQDRCDLPAG